MFAKMVTQVAHDIRSPLVSLDIIFKDITKLSNDQRKIVLSSINRINEITESLLAEHRNLHNEVNLDKLSGNSIEIVFPILADIIAEKKIQFKHRDIDIRFVSCKLTEIQFCKINASNFKRVISNLINNSVESIESSGEITIYLKNDFNNVIIEIKDTGCGIPDDLLNKLDKGLTYNKERGNGLGLQHAIKSIEKWGGSYHVSTKEKIGTSFSIFLPREEPPT